MSNAAGTDRAVAAAAANAATRPTRRFRWNALLIAGMVLFAGIVLVGILAPLLMSARANGLDFQPRLGMSWSHLFGTDDFGRDMLARTLVATRLTLIMAFVATALGATVGVLLGALLWIAPRRVRELGLRVLETAVAYPGLLVTIVIVSILGAGAEAIVIGIAVAGIHGYARLTANLVAGIVHRDFVVTARLLGVPRIRMIARHLLPNIAEPMLIVVSSGFGGAVLDLSGLSFIGLGVQSPRYDYGKLLIDALPAIYTQPAQVVGPALMIVLTILGAMLIGDGLAAAADPRTGRRGRRVDWADMGSEVAATARTAPVRPRPAAWTAIDGDPRDAEPPFVEVRDLRVRTGAGQELLHGVSLSIRAGEILGVVGESGSGKSMTAMALAALLPEGVEARAGTLRIDGMDMLGTPDPARLARTVALIYQDPATTFSPVLRMGRQLTDALRAHGGASRLQAQSMVLSALGAVRMSHPRLRLKQYPHELSGGMRQRSMIAAALAARPRLIIADEPTTGLDVIVQAEILRELKRINVEHGTAMLFISHDIGVVGALCDRVVVMKDGLIVEQAAAGQLASGNVVHPYTQMLLRATPRITEGRAVEGRGTEGRMAEGRMADPRAVRL